MATYPNVYVFLSADRTMFGLTVEPNGANLPMRAAGWEHYDVIPMTLNYLARYAQAPDPVHVNLMMHGYHLSPVSGNIVPLPQSR